MISGSCVNPLATDYTKIEIKKIKKAGEKVGEVLWMCFWHYVAIMEKTFYGKQPLVAVELDVFTKITLPN